METKAASEMSGRALPFLDRLRPGDSGRPLILGLAGAQGSGKSTLAASLVADLSNSGRKAAAISIDDFYLSRAERRKLAADVHPLFVTRGPPGTHDIAAAGALIDVLRAGGGANAPVFDKSRDDPAPDRRELPAGLDILIFEGWCVGARPQDAAALIQPVNTLERIYDSAAIWRRAANEALRQSYQTLFAKLDALIYLRPPSFENIAQWRWQQEEALAKREPHGACVMTRDEISYFVQYYERITRWMMDDAPSHADLTLRLNEKRQVVGEDRSQQIR